MKNYYLTIDTETANGLDCPIMYDCGFAVHDKRGNIVEEYSYIIAEVFFNDELFQSAYYADKRPQYLTEIRNGKRTVASIYTVRRVLREVCAKYKVKAIIAYNARFDYSSTNTTLRYLTKSACRYFLPYGIPVWDSWKMAKDTICKQKGYKPYCIKNGLLCKNGTVKTSAEAVYGYMLKDSFTEEHTGLEDVHIEVEIFANCYRQHKPMRKLLWGPPKRLRR